MPSYLCEFMPSPKSTSTNRICKFPSLPPKAMHPETPSAYIANITGIFVTFSK